MPEARVSARCRDHFIALPHKELVIEQIKQAIECGTHGRLAQAYLFASPGGTAFARQRVKNAQQIQVETGEIHDANGPYKIIRFP
jgi:hypothetical protein